jgi:hypothetical protein
MIMTNALDANACLTPRGVTHRSTNSISTPKGINKFICDNNFLHGWIMHQPLLNDGKLRHQTVPQNQRLD